MVTNVLASSLFCFFEIERIIIIFIGFHQATDKDRDDLLHRITSAAGINAIMQKYKIFNEVSVRSRVMNANYLRRDLF